jgi:uncharacterized MAPEG superfamily protein
MGGPAIELRLLGLAVIIGLVQLVWATVVGSRQRSREWLAGPRDESVPAYTGAAGRLDRAFRNYMETFPLFAAALIAAYLMAKLGPLTVWGAGLYVAGRALYVPLYVAGVPVLRSLVWTLASVGLVMVVTALFR